MDSSNDTDVAAGEGNAAGQTTAAMDAKARREARKARILGAGSDRLARITKTGRGGEAGDVYSSPPKPLGRTPSANVVDKEEDEVLRRANAAIRGNTGNDDDDPQDIDISQTQTQMQQHQQSPHADPFMAALMGQQQGQGQTDAGMPPDMQNMMRAMQQAMGGGGAPNVATDGTSGPPPFPFAGQGAQTAMAEPQGPSLLDAIFNILRALVFVVFGVALAYGALRTGHADAAQSVSDSADAGVVEKFDHMTRLHRWARLAYERPAHWEARYFGIESFGFAQGLQDIPVFWLLITLEVGLASTRIMLQRRRPQPPGMLLKVASFIPNANIQFAIRALAAYLPLLDAFINDLAIVVFTIGCAVMFAAWKVGLDPLSAPYDGTVSGSALSSGFARLAEAAQDVVKSTGVDSPAAFEAVAAAPPM